MAENENARNLSESVLKILEKMAMQAPELVLDFKDFVIDEEIGKGAEGAVYKATSKRKNDRKHYAVKQPLVEKLDDRQFRRFLSEIQISLRCRTPYTYKFIGFMSKYPYGFVTEYMPKNSLSKCISGRPGRRLKDTEKAIIALGVARGLQRLHDQNIIHRDIKCGNILLDNKMYPHICDFGLATVNSTTSTKASGIGTPAYMAPELIAKSTDYGPSVDMYSFAMVLYELSEPERLKKIDRNELYQRVVVEKQRPKFTSATTPAMRELITNMWDHDPDKRYTAAAAVKYIEDNIETIFPVEKRSSLRDKVAEYNNWVARKDTDASIIFQDIDDPTDEEYPAQHENNGADILCDPTNPKFPMCVKWVASDMTHKELTRHIKIVENAFSGQDLLLQWMWVVVFDCFVSRSAKFIPVIRDIISKIRVTNNNVVYVTQLLWKIVEKGKADEIDWLAVLKQLRAISFEKCIALIDLFVNLEKVDVIIGVVHSILEELIASSSYAPSTWKFIDLLRKIAATDSRAEELMDSVWTIFKSTDNEEIISSCLDFFGEVNVRFPSDLPIEKLIACIPAHCESVCEILLANPEIARSPALLDALLLRFDDPFVPPVLAALADSPDGATFLANNLQWLIKFEHAHTSVLPILLIVTKHTQALSETPELLKTITFCATQTSLISVACTLASTTVSQSTCEHLSQAGFWKHLHQYLQSSDRSHHKSIMHLLYNFSSKTRIPDFNIFTKYVLEFIYKQDMWAFYAFTALTTQPEIAKQMTADHLKYFSGIAAKGGRFKNYAAVISNNLSSCK